MTNMLRVRTVLTGVAGSPWYSNLYFSATTPAATAEQVTTAVQTFWTALKDHMLTGTVLTIEPEVPVINSDDGKIVDELTASQKVVNAGTGLEPLPFATQGLVRWSTNAFINGRRVRGRTFIPSMLEANNANGGPSSTLQNAVNTAASILMNDTTNTYGIFARPFTPVKEGQSARLGSFHGATAGSMWSKWAVLRSRRD